MGRSIISGPDLGEGFPDITRRAIEAGERALTNLRENTVQRWISTAGPAELVTPDETAFLLSK
jgi:hypothetical protein